ncbi:MAG: right-handed parallel beta-helix repeat-containing protein [Candidatus Thorarchaeota archaeon]|nr:right-handed parallel beta-helix repeat-containing protein [Candidatus Thorarchaeota archaeon]
MKGKLLAFIVVLSLFVTVVSVGNPAHSFVEEPIGPTRILNTSQTDPRIVISSNIELAEQSSAGVGTRSDPYIIEGKTINSSLPCVSIYDTTAFFVIRDSEFIHEASESVYGEISTIHLSRIEHGIIENCHIRGGDVGIEIRESTDCSIIDSIIYDAYNGIVLDSSNNNTIVNCSIFSNTMGVMILTSNFCNIIGSSIYSNSQQGVYVSIFSENNTIAGNSIGWNAFQNAQDNGVNTTFTDSIRFGNEWSNYNASENYAIPGSGNSIDTFASQLTDSARPIINELPDLVIEFDIDGNTLTWVPSDRFHNGYQIHLNNFPVEIGTWDGNAITFSLDGLDIGTHVIILYVMDGAGNVASDEVVMSVMSFILGGIGTELVMLASGVTVVIFLLVIIIIKKFP